MTYSKITCFMQSCNKFAIWKAYPTEERKKRGRDSPAYYCQQCKSHYQENNNNWKKFTKLGGGGE